MYHKKDDTTWVNCNASKCGQDLHLQDIPYQAFSNVTSQRRLHFKSTLREDLRFLSKKHQVLILVSEGYWTDSNSENYTSYLFTHRRTMELAGGNSLNTQKLRSLRYLKDLEETPTRNIRIRTFDTREDYIMHSTAILREKTFRMRRNRLGGYTGGIWDAREY